MEIEIKAIKKVSARGRVEYFIKNSKDKLVFHREDGPAIIAINGSKYWYKYGKYHRIDGPAVDLVCGKQIWYKDGKFHREDGPAWIENNSIKYYVNNQFHRIDGPAVIYDDGRQFWYFRGKYHRFDGPAIVMPDGRREWYRNGKKHREDGPAVVIREKYYWYWHGKLLTFQEFWKKVRNGQYAAKIMAFILGAKGIEDFNI